MQQIRLGRFQPSGDVAEARMLRASGSLTVTVSSRRSGRHVTLRVRCSRRDPFGRRRWPTVAFADATHVFIDDFDGEQVATYDPLRGVLKFSARASDEARWTTEALLRYLAGAYPKLSALADVYAMAHCRRCDSELTDPESIERGYGPVCWGEATGSRALVAVS